MFATRNFNYSPTFMCYILRAQIISLWPEQPTYQSGQLPSCQLIRNLFLASHFNYCWQVTLDLIRWSGIACLSAPWKKLINLNFFLNLHSFSNLLVNPIFSSSSSIFFIILLLLYPPSSPNKNLAITASSSSSRGLQHSSICSLSSSSLSQSIR